LRSLDIEASRINAESLIRNFSRYIFYKIGKFRYFKYGLERDDLLQDIYLKIWRYYEKNDKDISIPRSYIDAIINSVLINSIKKSKNEIKALNRLKLNIQESRVQKNTSQLNILNELILDSLNEIKAPSKIVISLCLVGFTLAEIAKLQSWGQSKTNNLYYRGIDKLKIKLKAKGILYED
jgi:RNA polymerase sigma factor (sigma-70 family)